MSVLIGKGDEFAAEAGDVGDHAAPDHFESSLESSECVSGGPLVRQKT